jgi:hypothetical protein
MNKQLTFLTRGRNTAQTETVVLTEAQINHYNEHGYVIPEYRLPSEQVEAIKAQYSRLIELHPEFSDYCPALLIQDTGFLNFARNDAILDMVGRSDHSRHAPSGSPLMTRLPKRAVLDFGPAPTVRKNSLNIITTTLLGSRFLLNWIRSMLMRTRRSTSS